MNKISHILLNPMYVYLEVVVGSVQFCHNFLRMEERRSAILRCCLASRDAGGGGGVLWWPRVEWGWIGPERGKNWQRHHNPSSCGLSGLQAAQTSASYIAGRHSSRPIRLTEMLLGIWGKISLHPEETSCCLPASTGYSSGHEGTDWAARLPEKVKHGCLS